MSDELTPNERAKLDHWTPMTPPSDFADRVLTARGQVVAKPRSYRWIAAASAVAVAAVALIALVTLRTHEDRAMAVQPSAARPSYQAEAREDAKAEHAVAATIPPPMTPSLAKPPLAPANSTDPFDLAVTAGHSFVVHSPYKDPNRSIRIRFSLYTVCKSGVRVTLRRKGVRLTVQPGAGTREVVAEGTTYAIVPVGPGTWTFTAGCRDGSYDTTDSISVIHDEARRKLIPSPSTDTIYADVPTWRVIYQSAIPDLVMNVKSSNVILHIASGGVEHTFKAKDGKITVPSKILEESTYTYYLERDGTKDTKLSTLVIELDNTAPQIYIAEVRKAGTTITVRGLVHPGWSVEADTVDVPVSATGQFTATLPSPAALRMVHPQRGIHYIVIR